MNWLIEEGVTNPAEARPQTAEFGVRGGGTLKHDLAVFLKPLQVLNTRKWFGAAELRLDVVVVHGGGANEHFHPRTLRFPRVNDGDDLATGPHGLMVFLGRPEHFLYLSIMLSRDTKDSDDLAMLFKTGSPEFLEALGTLAALAVAAPQVAALQAGLSAALAIGDLGYRLVRQVSPTCLGLYRASWLGARHRFGIGRHPKNGAERQQDFRVGYEISLNK